MNDEAWPAVCVFGIIFSCLVVAALVISLVSMNHRIDQQRDWTCRQEATALLDCHHPSRVELQATITVLEGGKR